MRSLLTGKSLPDAEVDIDLRGDIVKFEVSRAELAACLRGAVKAMELLDHYVEPDYTPGLPALIERSKQALLEYDK